MSVEVIDRKLFKIEFFALFQCNNATCQAN